MRNGRGVDREMKVVQGVKNEGSTKCKSLHAVRKGQCGEDKGEISRKIVRSRIQNEEKREKVDFTGQKTGASPRKIARSRTQNEERREKSGLHRAKNESVPSKKCRKLSLKRRKARKTDILGRKRWGGVAAKKWALLPILQRYEVAKWVQMKFSRIFFR